MSESVLNQAIALAKAGKKTAHTDHRLDLETLLSWRFQSFKNVQNQAV